MAEIHQDPHEVVCQEIVEDLSKDDPGRVLLSGESGIGKTRMAKMVGQKVISKGICLLTICLHLNNKFKDKLSLYENIASQLCAYSDFEETEVDDRDEEDEEKKDEDALLVDLKKTIVDEIEKRIKEKKKEKEKEAEEKKKPKKVYEKKTEVVDKKQKEPAEKLGDGQSKPAVEKEKEAVIQNTPVDGENPSSTEMPYLLLILDDEGNKTTEKEVMDDLELREFLTKHTRLKILITKRGEKEQTKTDEKIASKEAKTEQENEEEEEEEEKEEEKEEEEEEEEEEVKEEEEEKSDSGIVEAEKTEETEPPPAGKDEAAVPAPDKSEDDKSKSLTDSISEDYLKHLFNDLMKENWKNDVDLVSNIVEKSKNSPAAIVVLAKSLNQIIRNTSVTEKQSKEEELKKMIDKVLSADRSNPINPILQLAYVLLETDGLPKDADGPRKDAILDCFWHSLDFFEHCGCVYYRDLITQWILEGYFDPVRSVEKAYQDGHTILMELINRRILKIQENNVVVPEMAMKTLIDPRRRGHFGRSRLAFSRVYAGDKKKGIGKITQIDDMIKTVQAKKGDKITTILVSGDRLRRVTPVKYFKKLGVLEVLGLFEPTLEPFITSFKSLIGLRVLVIRDCDLLKDIEELKDLKKLHALEVSGASSLTKISDTFFDALTELQSLHLSRLHITSSPSSISKLTELHCLIIKDCPLLEDLPDIQELVKLEVVDVSGAHGLQTCFDNTKGDNKNKSKNKNFYHLTKLQLLDFSESQIERLPLFQDAASPAQLQSFTRLLLRNCSKLRRLPSLKPLSGLQILDLSGTTSLVEMFEVCFEDKKELTTLNLSRTNLGELATTIEELTGLIELLMSDCTNLEILPDIQKLTNLEVIDVSGCTKLHTIDCTFEDMSYLREVNLSGTKVKTPKLPKETKIHCPKSIILADGRRFEGKDWEEVKKSMPSDIFEIASSSGTVAEPEEISEKEPEKIGEIQPSEPRSSDISEIASSSGTNVEPQEISEIEPEKIGEIQPSEPCASDCTEKEDVIRNRLFQVPINEVLKKALLEKTEEKKALPDFDFASCENVMEINETNIISGEALANAKSLSFVEITSPRLKSIFKETKSVKDCWVGMSMDIKELFSGMAAIVVAPEGVVAEVVAPKAVVPKAGTAEVVSAKEAAAAARAAEEKLAAERLAAELLAAERSIAERLESVETLSITNLQSLETINWGGNFKNLKKLNIECCPNIKFLFRDASHIPSNLEQLRIKHCEQLEKVFEKEGEMPNLTTLRLHELPKLSAVGAKLPNIEFDRTKWTNCPKFSPPQEEWVIVRHSDASSQQE